MDRQRARVAFVDESLPDSSTYILAATICGEHELDVVRGPMTALLLRGQRKVHWRNEDSKRHLLIAEAVASMPVRHLVVVRSGRSAERPERQRQKTLERLLYELHVHEVNTVTFESRGPADDRHDVSTTGGLRAHRTISSQMRIEHIAGPREPMLWVADAVCGATVQDRVGDHTYLEAIRARADVQVIPIGAS